MRLEGEQSAQSLNLRHRAGPYARRRRRLTPRARLLRRARDERVSVNAVGAPEGRPGGLAPRRRLDGMPSSLQRALETLLAGETRRVDFAPAASHLGAWT